MFYRSDHPCLEVSGQSPDLWMLVYRLAGLWDRSQIGLSRHVSVRYILKRSLNIDRISTSPRSKSSCTIPRRWVPMAVGWPCPFKRQRWKTMPSLEFNRSLAGDGMQQSATHHLDWRGDQSLSWASQVGNEEPYPWSAVSIELARRFSELCFLLLYRFIHTIGGFEPASNIRPSCKKDI